MSAVAPEKSKMGTRVSNRNPVPMPNQRLHQPNQRLPQLNEAAPAEPEAAPAEPEAAPAEPEAAPAEPEAAPAEPEAAPAEPEAAPSNAEPEAAPAPSDAEPSLHRRPRQKQKQCRRRSPQDPYGDGPEGANASTGENDSMKRQLLHVKKSVPIQKKKRRAKPVSRRVNPQSDGLSLWALRPSNLRLHQSEAWRIPG